MSEVFEYLGRDLKRAARSLRQIGRFLLEAENISDAERREAPDFNRLAIMLDTLAGRLGADDGRNEAIRERWASGATQKSLATEYGLSPQRIGQILHGCTEEHQRKRHEVEVERRIQSEHRRNPT